MLADSLLVHFFFWNGSGDDAGWEGWDYYFVIEWVDWIIWILLWAVFIFDHLRYLLKLTLPSRLPVKYKFSVIARVHIVLMNTPDLMFFQFHGKSKLWAFFVDWFHLYLTSVLINYFLWNDEPKANSMYIYSSSILYKSKELKQLVLIFFFDADTSIFDTYSQKLIFVIVVSRYLAQSSFYVVNDYYSNDDVACLCELYSIWLQIQQHLLYPIFIVPNHRTILFRPKANIFKYGFQLNSLHISFDLLQRYNFSNCIHYIKFLDIFTEFALLYLAVVHEITNQIFHKMSWWMMDFVAKNELRLDILWYFDYMWSSTYFWIKNGPQLVI